ncbi:MAG: alpha/beta fold hydrolase [Bacteroidota bacterium]
MSLRSLLAVAFYYFSLTAFGQISTFDHFLAHPSSVPGFEGDTFQIHVREKVATALLDDPNTDYSGRTLILVHGFSVLSTPIFDAPYLDYSWMDQFAALGYDVFCMSMTGYGFSSRPAPMNDSCNLGFLDQLSIGTLCSNPYPFLMTSSDSEMDDLNTVFDFVHQLRGVNQSHVFGHSMGGGRVLLYTSRYPDKVDRIITHGFAGANLPADPPAMQPAAGNPVGLIRPFIVEEVVLEADCFDQVDPNMIAPIWQAIQATDTLGPSWDPDGLVRFPLVDLYGLNTDTIESIQHPVLVLTGEFDQLAPPFFGSIFYNQIGSSEKLLIEITKTSHTIYWERRQYVVPLLVDEWLSTGQLDEHTIGSAIFKLNDTFDWIGEFDENEPPKIASTFPADNAENVELDIDLLLELNENINNLGEYMTIFRRSDYSVFQSLELDANWRVEPICNNLIRFDIDTLEMNTEYFIYLHFDAFRDRSFNDFEGILTDKIWNFSTGLLTSSLTLNDSGPGFRVFPNPAKERIELQVDAPPANRTFQITNALGQVVHSSLWSGESLNIQHLSPGIYFISLQREGNWITKKLIKQ